MIRTRPDPVWNGLAIGLAAASLMVWLGSYEAHLREDGRGGDVAVVLAFGGVGLALDAIQHNGGRSVPLPSRRAAVVNYRLRF